MNFPIKPWTCEICTFINSKSYYKCGMCETELEKYSLDIPEEMVQKHLDKMKRTNTFLKTFNTTKVFLPVIHVNTLEETLINAATCFKNNVDGIFLINHEITCEELIDIFIQVRIIYPTKWIGLNILDRYPFEIFSLVNKIGYRVDGIWCDKIFLFEDKKYQNIGDLISYNQIQNNWTGLYFGSVAFKYQPQPKDLGKMIEISKKYVDIVVTSSEATGKEIDLDKAIKMKSFLGDFPLAVASGINEQNCVELKKYVDCFIVASSITDGNLINNDKISRLSLLIKN